MLHDNFVDLLQKPMDRKDFLKQIGIGAIMLTGASAVITSLLGRGKNTSTGTISSAATTYGASSYGTPRTNP